MSQWKRGLLLMALIFGAGIVLGAASVAQADDSSNRLAPYLRMGTGARALGMGGAFVGVADDATAAYWNPAGLTWTSGWEVTGMYSAGMNVDRTFNYVAFSRNGSMLGYALQWINAGMTDIDSRAAEGASRGLYDYGDNAFTLSLAKSFDVVSLGITGKYLRQGLSDEARVSDDSENGFAMDLGLGMVLTDQARLGVVVQNVASKLGEFDNVNTIPATLRAGIAVLPADGLTAAFDFEKTRDDDARFHAGAEYAMALTDDFGTALRVGLNHDKFAGGLGLRYNFLTFDYAYVVEPEKFLGENHRFSVSLNFGREQAVAERVHDRDGDGIPDDVDQCPDLAEDFEGYQDSDGCPEGGPPKPEPVPPPATQGQQMQAPPPIPTLAYINFKFATAEISGADPIPVLEDVVRIMKERPELRVQITGHTDAIGGDEANMGLSIRRAEAVKQYIVARGVSGDRLLTVGKGESQPIDTNDTDIGRARNRRIEFTILQ